MIPFPKGYLSAKEQKNTSAKDRSTGILSKHKRIRNRLYLNQVSDNLHSVGSCEIVCVHDSLCHGYPPFFFLVNSYFDYTQYRWTDEKSQYFFKLSKKPVFIVIIAISN